MLVILVVLGTPSFADAQLTEPDVEVVWNSGIPGQRLYEIDPWVEPDTVGDSTSAYGDAVDIEGDVIVVGSPASDMFGVNFGAAFVYERSGDTWLRSAALGPSSDPEKPDSVRHRGFGSEVVIDEGRVFVAAPGHDAWCNIDVGAIYVFEKGPNGWEQVDRLWRNGNDADAFCDNANFSGDYFVPLGMSPDDNFGRKIHVSGDVLIAHSFNRSFGRGFNCRSGLNFHWWEEGGAVQVFRDGPSGWVREQKITIDGEFLDFGVVDGDTMILSSGGEEVESKNFVEDCDRSDPPAHKFRVFEHQSGEWSEIQQIDFAPGDDRWYVFRSGDIDGDWAFIGTERDNDETVWALKRQLGGDWAIKQTME
ncbi:MAG: FG-GAP repeat protein, partial [Acidimicrobiia bacterium]|nr:FG-GAP repeat protein [Acidimicrobiia bacterium]